MQPFQQSVNTASYLHSEAHLRPLVAPGNIQMTCVSACTAAGLACCSLSKQLVQNLHVRTQRNPEASGAMQEPCMSQTAARGITALRTLGSTSHTSCTLAHPTTGQ